MRKAELILEELPGMELRHEQPKQESHMARTIEMDNQINAMPNTIPKFEAGRGSSVSGIPHRIVTITEPQSVCKQIREHGYSTRSKPKDNADDAPLGKKSLNPCKSLEEGHQWITALHSLTHQWC